MSTFQTLFKQPLVIQRYEEGGGYLDDQGNWQPANKVDIPMTGNILPYRETDIIDGNRAEPQKYGFDSQDIRRVFTDQLTKTVKRETQQEADEIIVDGDVYVCFRIYNYLNVPLVSLRHCESIFVKRDRLAAGSVGSGN